MPNVIEKKHMVWAWVSAQLQELTSLKIEQHNSNPWNGRQTDISNYHTETRWVSGMPTSEVTPVNIW